MFWNKTNKDRGVRNSPSAFINHNKGMNTHRNKRDARAKHETHEQSVFALYDSLVSAEASGDFVKAMKILDRINGEGGINI